MKTIEQLSDAERIDVSIELARMLESDAFLLAVQMLANNYADTFFRSGFDANAERENAYRNNQVLHDLIATMKTIILMGNNIRDAYSDDNEDIIT